MMHRTVYALDDCPPLKTGDWLTIRWTINEEGGPTGGEFVAVTEDGAYIGDLTLQSGQDEP